jgi:hypothetical protein
MHKVHIPNLHTYLPTYLPSYLSKALTSHGGGGKEEGWEGKVWDRKKGWGKEGNIKNKNKRKVWKSKRHTSVLREAGSMLQISSRAFLISSYNIIDNWLTLELRGKFWQKSWEIFPCIVDRPLVRWNTRGAFNYSFLFYEIRNIICE